MCDGVADAIDDCTETASSSDEMTTSSRSITAGAACTLPCCPRSGPPPLDVVLDRVVLTVPPEEPSAVRPEPAVPWAPPAELPDGWEGVNTNDELVWLVIVKDSPTVLSYG